MSSRRHLAAAAALILALCTMLASTASAQVCECKFPESNANGRVAGAFGGGLFGGLVLAVLHIKHQREASGVPAVVPVGDDPPVYPVTPMVSAGSIDAQPSPDAAAERQAGPHRAGEARKPQFAAAPEPPMSAREARREGLLAPKTASMLPAFAMMGVGFLVLGLFLVRERSGHRHRR